MPESRAGHAGAIEVEHIIYLPNLGEAITGGDVLNVLVKPGGRLAKGQPFLELETDKSTIEISSSVAGRVKAVNVKAGDKVKVGQAILTVIQEHTQEQTAAMDAQTANARKFLGKQFDDDYNLGERSNIRKFMHENPSVPFEEAVLEALAKEDPRRD